MISADCCCGSTNNEYHELLVTYEGPAHPASICNGKKLLCIRLPPTGVDELSTSSYVSEKHVLASLSERIGWPESILCIDRPSSGAETFLFFPSKSFLLSDEDDENDRCTMHQHPPLIAKIHPRHTLIRGGKGGFGTLLKGQSKQAGAKATIDFGACRDLSGRRLRHVNDEIKLRKWRELQQKRERGEDVDELAALKTESGIRNWHLMVPNWSDGAVFTNKGRRKHERQLEKEVRSWQSKEERARRQKEEKKMEQELAVMEYIRRGEVESARVSADNVKESILAHLKKRKIMEKQELKQQNRDLVPKAFKNAELEQDSVLDKDDTSPSSSLMTLSGEMSVFDVPQSEQGNKMQGQHLQKIRIQSQSDFATVGVILDAEKLKETPKRGIYLEYTVVTGGIAQIGWISVPPTSRDDCEIFLPNSDTGDGVGDDNVSYGYDGSRKLKFNGGKDILYGNVQGSKGEQLVEWKAGDVLGSWCNRSKDEKNVEIGYLLNGKDLGVAFRIPAESNENHFGYYPALSLNLGEVVDVNLGPEFSHDVMKGCVGASELIKINNVESPEDETIINVESVSKRCDHALLKKRPREEDETTKSPLETVATETFDLNSCTSAQELVEFGPARLKSILLAMGIKCGGTLEQRAERLFSLKGLRREDYPQKARGKNFIV